MASTTPAGAAAPQPLSEADMDRLAREHALSRAVVREFLSAHGKGMSEAGFWAKVAAGEYLTEAGAGRVPDVEDDRAGL